MPQGLTSNNVRFPIKVAASANDESGVEWTQTLPVDGSAGFLFSVFVPTDMTVELYDSSGVQVPNLAKYASQGNYVIGDDSYYSIPTTTYSLPNFAPGVYTLKLVASSLSAEKRAKMLENDADGYVFLATPTPVESLAYLNSYSLLKDNIISLTAQMYDSSLFGTFNGTLPVPLPSAERANLLVELPDGSEFDVNMSDDGEWPDEVAGDGVFGGSFKATEVGSYVLSTLIAGTDDNGNAYLRSTEHLIPVIEATFSLNGEASAAISNSGDVLNINLGVSVTSENTATSVRGYAEVYGTHKGDLVPVAWVGGIVDINDNNYVTLALDLGWVALAEAQAPFLLQNIYLSDIGTNIPVTTISQIKVDTSAVENLADFVPEKPKEITKKMREGKMPERYANRTPKNEDDPVEVVFVHGYCAEQNPWQKSGNFPTDEKYFLNPGASLDNDAFALMIAAYADPLDAYSLVGHSQGGMASLHLMNYYFTGVSANTAPRSIQSVGTPYQGNSGAGAGADLIKTFGIGCGANPSLTKDGAKLWLSGITTEARKEVYYYTTQYEPGLFKYCQAGVGLVLSAPNDGTAEKELSQLPGANNMGHTEGQCHTENMNFPPQCYDTSRNKAIFENAIPEEKRQRLAAKAKN